jgi:DNA-binding response OmpR family regulator
VSGSKNNMDKKRILIIEDDSSLQKVVQEFLESEGFDTVGAEDGIEGIKLANSKKPDLILLDIILPKKDGYEVLKELKENQETKNIPIILLTNLGSPADVEKAIKLGATTYLTKSDYKLEEVAEKIRETLKVAKK